MTDQVKADDNSTFFISQEGTRIALPKGPVAEGATQIVIRPSAFSLSAADGNHWLDVTISELLYKGSEMVLYCKLADSGEAFPSIGTAPFLGLKNSNRAMLTSYLAIQNPPNYYSKH